jgi:hypothetical protein
MMHGSETEYRAAYWFRQDRVDAKLLDFPEVVATASDHDSARLALREAMWDVLESYANAEKQRPVPNPDVIDVTADLIEPVTWIDSSTFPGFIEISDTAID